mmetsp:Transcript_30087/g.66624  ORF Transcript_30087/g.66624 Transcript_30087/m.66624 type:complete len:913 (-) Transcript_30087:48-2786(-)
MASSNLSSADDAFQLQMELADLRNRISVLDSGGEKSELLDLLKERDAEITIKNKQLDLLNRKFRQISEGLQKIESERQELRASYAKLEKEKGRVDRHLDMREKEIVTIAQRCAVLEEKIQESVPLRVANNNLAKERAELLKEAATMKKQIDGLEPIQADLVASRMSTKEAHDKISKLEKEAKAMSGISQSQQVKIKDMEESIQALNTERDSERKDLRALTDDLQRSKGETDAANKRLEEYCETIASMKKTHAEELNQLAAVHSKKLADSKSQSNANDETLRAEIARLTDTLTSTKSKASQLTSDLQKERGDNEDLGKKYQDEKKSRDVTESELLLKLKCKSEEISTLKSSFADASNTSNVLSCKVDTLQENIKTLEEELSDKISIEDELCRTHGIIERLRDEKDKMENSHGAQLSKLEQDLEDAWASKAEVEKTFEAKIKSVNDEKTLMENDLSETSRAHQSEIISLKNRIENLLRQNADTEKQHKAEISDLRMDRSSLKTDLEARVQSLNEEKDELEKSSREDLERGHALIRNLEIEVTELRSELDRLEQSRRQDLAAKDEHIQELEGVSLVNARKEVASLQSRIEALEKNNTDAEMAAAEIVADLEMKITDKENKSASINAALTSMRESYESEQAISKSLNSRLKKYRLDLEHARSESTELRVTVGKLEAEQDTVKDDLEDTRSQIASLQAEVNDLSFCLGNARKQISSDTDTIEKQQTLLSDRTKLLGDMVKQNREVERDLEEARGLVTELQEESDRYLQTKASSEMERRHLRDELKQKEIQYAETIRQERCLRDDVENELCKVRSELDRYRLEFKSIDELTKENLALKDKIRRQEAYLKRKLEKEKVSRNSLKGVPSLRTSSRHSNGSASIGRTGGRAPLSEVTFDAEYATMYGSPADEIDEILQDDV